MHLTQQEQRNTFIKKITICFLGLIVTVFVGAKLYPFIHGPEIEVFTMIDGAHLTEPMIELSGTAHFTKDLIINGTPLATTPDGGFDERLVLNPGYNIITMEGRDRFGKSTTKNYTFVLTEQPDTTFTLEGTPISIN